MTTFAIENFQALLTKVTDYVADKPLDDVLQRALDAEFPAQGEYVQSVISACLAGIDAGALCKHEAGGIKYGRVIKPTSDLSGFSVDVVDMNDIAGPHHIHPNGEIDLIMPLEEGAAFDGKSTGWMVYGPGSAHTPTVTDGRALVLYLLPEGSIEFTRPA